FRIPQRIWNISLPLSLVYSCHTPIDLWSHSRGPRLLKSILGPAYLKIIDYILKKRQKAVFLVSVASSARRLWNHFDTGLLAIVLGHQHTITLLKVSLSFRSYPFYRVSSEKGLRQP
ncbi:MAG: hypothetical protein KAK04_19650, partial [Cyclobacteriaceae bacterium]|nr:hypothetical protein [Cyclobacteriaceae bacterium]